MLACWRNLFCRYPSLRVAYIDEVEEPSKDRSKKIEKVYYSALVKAALAKADDSDEPVQNLDEVKCFRTCNRQFVVVIFV